MNPEVRAFLDSVTESGKFLKFETQNSVNGKADEDFYLGSERIGERGLRQRAARWLQHNGQQATPEAIQRLIDGVWGVFARQNQYPA